MNYKFIYYKYRFFIGYIFIGVLSILIEIILYNFLSIYSGNEVLNSLFAVIIGILISFWLNIRYNFKVSKSKRNKALGYFVLISIFSYLIQIFFIKKIQVYLSYEISRILISGSMFWIAYFFHSKFSFKDFKKVGVAIYANGVEDINQIFNNISNFPDFIHIDIVDESVNKNSKEVLSYKAEVIKAFWNSKFIEAHIMSKTPKKWILDIIKHVDRIYIQVDINEDLNEILTYIKNNNCEAGLVLQNKKDIDFFEKHYKLIDSILILAIEKPGFSGQQFEMKSLELITLINNHKYRNRITLNVDGGVNAKNIYLLKSENVVSGSYVLNSENPIKNIMILQTSSQYESI
tara:strand:- start:110 stop:1150 length:1041 start_codon:yes stop_codon:yes gene_type:complete